MFRPHRGLVAFGANLGKPQQSIDAALARLASAAVTIESVSSSVETRAVGGPAGQPPFLNGAAVVATELTAEQLHQRLQQIEIELGRSRNVEWGPRIIDLDLLLFRCEGASVVIDSPALTVPHPRMAVRSFVLGPASQVAGDWVHPWLGCTIAQMWQRWQQGDPVVELRGTADECEWMIDRIFQQGRRLAILTPTPLTGGHISQQLSWGDVARVSDAPKLCFCTNRGVAPKATPTLVVDMAQPALASRDMLAALADAWPDLPGGERPG